MKMEKRNKIEKKKKGNSSSSSSMKVVYISSPMKVQTTASRFRELVQQLTGRDSDITKSMDIVHNCNNNLVNVVDPRNNKANNKNVAYKSVIPADEDIHLQQQQYQELQYFSSPVETTSMSRGFSPSSSESMMEQQEVYVNCDAFLSSEGVEDQFLEDVFTSSLFFDNYSQSHLLDAL